MVDISVVGEKINMTEPRDSDNVTEAFERILEHPENKYLLKLYVTGMTPRSRAAIDNLKKFCRDNLEGRCELEIIDIYQHPELARAEQIIASPTLIKKLPLPMRKLIGDLSNIDKILVALDIKAKE